MLRTMCFIDWQNFIISYRQYVQTREDNPVVDVIRLSEELNKYVRFNSQVIKTYLFVSKPCEQLMKIEKYKRQYEWAAKFRKVDYFEVIEGRQTIRYINNIDFNPEDRNTFTTLEKGTDVNIATQMLAKGFLNSYDIAILVSGDSDYIPIIDMFHQIGKIVVLATLPNQNVDIFVNHVDKFIDINNKIVTNLNYRKTI